MLILWASHLSKKFAFLPNISSVDTTKGVKDAHCTSGALFYFLFFSYSAVESTVTLLQYMYDGASVSTSSNATVRGCHSSLILMSAIKSEVPYLVLASCTTGSFSTLLNTIEARSPSASLKSLWCWVTRPPFFAVQHHIHHRLRAG